MSTAELFAFRDVPHAYLQLRSGQLAGRAVVVPDASNP